MNSHVRFQTHHVGFSDCAAEGLKRQDRQEEPMARVVLLNAFGLDGMKEESTFEMQQALPRMLLQENVLLLAFLFL